MRPTVAWQTRPVTFFGGSAVMPFLHCRKLYHGWTLLAGLCLAAPPAAVAAAPTVVSYVPTGATVDSRYEYDWAVLRAALEKTRERHGPFELREVREIMSQARVLQELQAPAGKINVLVRATSSQLEKQFLPVRIPVDRGLLGYRTFLVRQADLPRFAAVRKLDDLRRLKVGQGKGWIDVPILQAAGFKVIEGSAYDGLFLMLAAGRFDFFSRSADEALREYGERHSSLPEIALEPTLLLHYPLPRYFFTRRDAAGEKLARRITEGLEIMLRDGSFHALFLDYKSAIIERAGLHNRRVLRLPNPDLSPETPLARKELWYDPLAEVSPVRARLPAAKRPGGVRP